jgi:hypothetical protein
MFNAAINLSEQLIDNECPLVTQKHYVSMQRERGFYNFINLKDYRVALSCFEEWCLPLE